VDILLQYLGNEEVRRDKTLRDFYWGVVFQEPLNVHLVACFDVRGGQWGLPHELKRRNKRRGIRLARIGGTCCQRRLESLEICLGLALGRSRRKDRKV
jgi:hypothetical protein